MILDQDIANAAPSLFLAQRLTELERGVDPANVAASFQAIADGLVTYRVRPMSNAYPMGVWFSWPGYAVLLIVGSQTLNHAAELAAAYVVRIPGNTLGMPDYFDAGAFEYARVINFERDDLNRRIIIAGHSLGGALASAVALYMLDRRYSSQILVANFGAPRTGNTQFLQAINGVPIARWMNDDDPVPLLPPSFAESPGLSIHGIVRGTFYFAQYRHTKGGVSLADNGFPTSAEVPPGGIIQGSGSMAGWLWKLVQEVQSGHSMQTYVDRLTLLLAMQTPPAHLVVRTAPVEPNRETTRRENNAAATAVIQSIVHSSETQQNANLVVPPERAFTLAKSNGMWFVLFGGFVVAVGPSRKRAGSMALRGNEFLRRLQRQGAVDVGALSQLMTIYLTEASKVDNGFNPPIALFPSLS